MERRNFLKLPALAAAPAPGKLAPVTAEVRIWNNKPTLFVRGEPVYASFYALTDCPGGRWSFDELPQRCIRDFAAAGFRLFQLDLFLESVWEKEGPLDIDLARRQLRGVIEACPEAAIVIRWHLNAPRWWAAKYPDELTRYANGDFETIGRTQPVRLLMDDLRRVPRVSLASAKWRDMATAKTVELLSRLAKTPEGAALAGIQVACGVYGEWHYWGFMRNEPDTGAAMQRHFAAWRKQRGKAPAPVPGVEERAALDDGIFRDPAKRETVIDYYRCQQELVAENIIHFCRVVKKAWPRKILAGTFYGYFFSMFDRQATGGHLCLDRILAAPEVDYLSAPQAYGSHFRDLGMCGITRSLVESVRLNGKLFLDEMDQTPSWKWQNNVDTAFVLDDLASDIAIIRRNVVESYARGMGLWYYDFGPANASGWWADTRLMAEIRRLREVLDRYHRRPYEPAGDVLFVFHTGVYYYTGSMPGSDRVTDSLAVNQAIASAWRSGAALETIHLADLAKVDLARFKVVVFANTWLLTASQRRFIRERVIPGRRVIFQGWPGYCDGNVLSRDHMRELIDAPGGVKYSPDPITSPSEWRALFAGGGAHIYVEGDNVIHAGGGVVLVHTRDGGRCALKLKNGRALDLDLPPKSSLLFDAATGERLL
jgi:hypothetical protein